MNRHPSLYGLGGGWAQGIVRGGVALAFAGESDCVFGDGALAGAHAAAQRAEAQRVAAEARATAQEAEIARLQAAEEELASEADKAVERCQLFGRQVEKLERK